MNSYVVAEIFDSNKMFGKSFKEETSDRGGLK